MCGTIDRVADVKLTNAQARSHRTGAAFAASVKLRGLYSAKIAYSIQPAASVETAKITNEIKNKKLSNDMPGRVRSRQTERA